MSVATPVARSALRSTSTISRAEPRSISANAHACPTAPTPTTATLSSMATTFTASGSVRSRDTPIGVELGSVEPEFEIKLCLDLMPTPVGLEAQLEGEASDRAHVHLELAAFETEVLVLLDHPNRSPGSGGRARITLQPRSSNAVFRKAAMLQATVRPPRRRVDRRWRSPGSRSRAVRPSLPRGPHLAEQAP